MAGSHGTGIWSTKQLNFSVVSAIRASWLQHRGAFSGQITHLRPLHLEKKKTIFKSYTRCLSKRFAFPLNENYVKRAPFWRAEVCQWGKGMASAYANASIPLCCYRQMVKCSRQRRFEFLFLNPSQTGIVSTVTFGMG